LKDKNILISDIHRLEMANLAVSAYKHMLASDIETKLPVPSYTIDTMNYLEEKYPNHQWKIVMGTDGLATFDKWKNYKELCSRYKRIVYPRPGDNTDNLTFMQNAQLIQAPLLNISSTEIRTALSKGNDVLNYIPVDVYNYIKNNKLYIKLDKQL